MEFRVGGKDWRLLGAQPGATVGDLAAAVAVPVERLGSSPSTPLHRWDVVPGADLDDERVDGASAAVEIAAVGGLDAGHRAPLGPGRHGLGRAGGPWRTSDPTVSRRHAELTVGADGTATVRDAGSRNGTWLVDAASGVERAVVTPSAVSPGDRLRLGASEVVIGPARVDDAHALAFRSRTATPFNRPPRPAPPPPPDPVTVPEPEPEPQPALPLGVVAVVAPLAMAAVLVVLLDNLVFAAMALLSPVMAIGSHAESRRRTRRARRDHAERRGEALGRFAESLQGVSDAEQGRRAAMAPDPAEIMRRAELPSTRLWERRRADPDFLRLRVGTGDVAWEPPLRGHGAPGRSDIAAVVAGVSTLSNAAATVDVGILGIVGPRPAALAVARSLLCQAAVLHGPADVAVHVACSADAVVDWDWAKWLPHHRQHGADLVVVDGDELLEGRRSPVRAQLEAAAGIVVAASVQRLPAACTAVLTVDEHGEGELHIPRAGQRSAVRADGMSEPTARRCAMALARFDDPELDVTGARLPEHVPLVALLGARWVSTELRTPIGVADDGVVVVDLVRDGPHALVAGTTGAGKSELLRTLVVGLAAACDPEHVNFVLVDFKGGSAFDACARLPHVVGVVTDLDADLAERALRCLEAEVRHRERLLRAAGVADLAAYWRRAPVEALPRLVVVVDEFATLKAEVPGFVDALLGIAQRGRSLGMHLVLATQRPSGAVSADIRANTDLRIALRVQDAVDSLDVLDAPDAASLPRAIPGRACVRVGPAEPAVVQVAQVTTTSEAGDSPLVDVRPFALIEGERRPPSRPEAGGPTDLDRLVAELADAWAGRPPCRRPWPDPLPAVLDLPAVGAHVALADDPDGQRTFPIGWRPGDGNLCVYGAAGSGTTSTLLGVARALASEYAPDRLHLYGVDCGAGGLAVLDTLPHTGAVIGAAERERQHRLVRHLRSALDRRRQSAAVEPTTVVLVDGAAAFLAAFDDIAGLEVLDAFVRVVADGPDVGIHVVLAGDRPGALPTGLSALARCRWTHRLADPLDARTAGVDVTLPPGRFRDASTGLLCQVAVPADGWRPVFASIADRWRSVTPTPPTIGTLPASVAASAIRAEPSVSGRPWLLPVGVADEDLGPALLPLWEGEHVLVAGPSRSGRTTALATVATAALAAGVRVQAIAGRRSWVLDVDGVEPHDPGDPAPILLVDDAEAVDHIDVGPDVHVVAAGRADTLRGLYDHWTRSVRRSRVGLLLRPNLDLDGELLSTPLPRRVHVPLVPGRGLLVADGTVTLVHIAQPG